MEKVFKIGDIVSVLDDVIKGKVVKVVANSVFIENSDGFQFEYSPKELVVIKESQFELSKYSDISNEDLLQKSKDAPSKRKSIQFKSDLKGGKQPPMEVDLHIHQLVESTKGMDNYDILTIQMEHAKHKLNFAIKNRIQKIVFIHGVGEGVLKSELEFMLKNYNVDFYEASYKKYGFGATEVFIFQNP
jgi:hypothetical protein